MNWHSYELEASAVVFACTNSIAFYNLILLQYIPIVHHYYKYFKSIKQLYKIYIKFPLTLTTKQP